MIAEATALLDQFVDAYRPYVESAVSKWGSVDGLDAAVEAGAAWLTGALEVLLAQPFGAQRRGPLELFQEAMRFPTAALAGAGVPELRRDETVARALPGDVYDLAPESSRLLGEGVWRAHLAWGAAKARAMVQVRLIMVTRNLMDASQIEGAANTLGMASSRWSDGSMAGADLVCVDLESPVAADAMAQAVSDGVRVVAYGPHRATNLFENARSLGVEAVLPRSQFFRRLAAVLGEQTAVE